MINVNELRVGSKISTNKGDQYIQFFLGKDRVLLVGEGVNTKTTDNEPDKVYMDFVKSISDLIPIKITEAILLSTGFKEITSEPLFGIPPGELFYRLIYKIDNDKCPIIFKQNDRGQFCHVVPSNAFYGCSFKPILYYHNLQNLYLSLTGEELDKL